MVRWLGLPWLLYAAWGGMVPDAAQAQGLPPDRILDAYVELDKTGEWRADRNYIRTNQDSTWKARMRTLQQLVAAGEGSIPALLKVLKSGNDSDRVFAAQTLGYLAPKVPLAPLLEAAQNDPVAAVRLYAVDAVGMQGGKDHADTFKPLLQSERNRDVKKHLNYAIQRGKTGLDPRVVETLLRWDPNTMGPPKLGKPAPDFTLQTVDGKAISLSDYRDKRAVVLVFVYGDT